MLFFSIIVCACFAVHNTRNKGFDINLIGDTRIRARHIDADRNISIKLCGDTKIDLRESQLQPNSTLSFFIVALCGDVKIFVPRGTDVTLRRISLCGDKVIDIDESSLNESSPSVTATIIIPLGNVKVTN